MYCDDQFRQYCLFIVMNLSWQNLPQHIADKIFSNFTIRGLKALSLVSRSWLLNVDSYWKNKIVFDGENLTTKEDLVALSRSLRYFVNLKLARVESEYYREIFEIFQKREKSGVCYLESLMLYEYSNEDVLDILTRVGKSLRQLYICFGGEPSKNDSLNFEFENLRSVRKLTLYYPEKEFVLAIKHMKSIEKLRVGSPNDHDILVFRTLIEGNSKTLRSVSFQSQPFSNVDLTFFEAMKSLWKLDYSSNLSDKIEVHRLLLTNQQHLRRLRLSSNDITDEDLENISLNLVQLEEFTIDGFLRKLSKNTLSIIWNMKELKSLELHGCKLPESGLEEIISLKPKLKRLCLCRSTCNDDIAGAFIRKSPNIESLRIVLVEGDDPSFRIIQEAAFLHSLKSLCIQSRNLSLKDNLINGLLKTSPFLKLAELILYASRIDESCLMHISAPLLTSINLTSLHRLSDKSLIGISKNCPNIQRLNLSVNEGITDFSINGISMNLKNLTYLSCYTNSVTLDGVSSVVRNCKFLEYCDFGPLETKYSNQDEFERKVQELCEDKLTLRIKPDCYTYYELFNDLMEIKFSYKW